MVNVDPARVVASLGEWFQPYVDDWTIKCDALEGDKWVLAADHPASFGIVLEVPWSGFDVAMRRLRELLKAHELELRTAKESPDLVHRELVLGIRALIAAFHWSNEEIRSLVALLREANALTDAEANWLGRLEGSSARNS